MKYRIDSKAVMEKALALGKTSSEIALGAGVSIDTMAAIIRQDERQYTERVTLGLARSLECRVQDFATQA